MPEPEHASYETHAVLTPRRARSTRLALALSGVALVAIVGAGLSGPRVDPPREAAVATATAASASVAVALPRVAARPQEYPTKVIGLPVRRFEDIQPATLGSGDVVAIAGWYRPTRVTDCPPLAAIYRDGGVPDVRGGTDVLAFCVRTGVFSELMGAEEPSVTATLAIGIVAPTQLEIVGSGASQAVVVGHFAQPGACGPTCSPQLIVDHVAWTPG
jgi:hypothetical protein